MPCGAKRKKLKGSHTLQAVVSLSGASLPIYALFVCVLPCVFLFLRLRSWRATHSCPQEPSLTYSIPVTPEVGLIVVWLTAKQASGVTADSPGALCFYCEPTNGTWSFGRNEAMLARAPSLAVPIG